MWKNIRITTLALTLFVAWFTVVTASLGGQLWPLLAGVR